MQRRSSRIQRCRLIQRCCLSSQVLSPAHLQHGISECRGDSGGGFGYVYTFLLHTVIVVLVGVLVSCVPIPTSHYSVPFSRPTFSLAALNGGFGDGYMWRPHTIVAACWCVGFLCPHSNVPSFSSFLLLNFQPGSSEMGEGVILMGFLEMGTCGCSTPLLLLVGVLAFCVPIPTSHFFSSFLSLIFSLAALRWEKG